MPLAAIRRITERIRKAALAPAPSQVSASPAAPQAELAGALRLKDGPAMRGHLFSLLQAQPRVIVLDCSRVSHMDGCGLAVLLEFITACNTRQVRLKLIEPSARMTDVFALYGLSDAMAALAQQRAPELEGMLIILEEDFAESIRLGEVEGPEIVEEEDFPDSIRLPKAA